MADRMKHSTTLCSRQNNTEMWLLLKMAQMSMIITLLAEKKQDLLRILTTDNPSGGGVRCIQSWMQSMQNSREIKRKEN